MLINLRNALMAGKRTPTARDYVQSGLVAMWDGIENAGWGTHDANATTWKDLIGSANMTLANNGATYSWLDDALQVSQETSTSQINVGVASNAALNALLNAAGGFTVEVVAQKKSNFVSSPDRWIDSTTSHPFMIQSDRTNARVGCYTGNNVNVLNATTDTTKVFCVALTQNRSGGKVGYLNGRSFASNTSAYAVSFNSIVIHNRGGEKLRYCIRLYNRVLTADEIAANYAIDKARFGLP